MGCGVLAQAALSDGRITFARQGVHDIGNPGDLLYSECLARLVDGCGNIHSAGSFVPFLEMSGDIPLLDRHMLGSVLSALEDEPEAVLGCNLSACTISSQEHCGHLLEKIRLHAGAASRLILEITETSPLRGACVEEFLRGVRVAGCRVAIDDFGIGYATPARLFDLPVDIVKIDASFAHRVIGGREGRDSLYHMVGLAACAAPVVIVEGVETQEHACAARAAGATHVQGYFFSEPVMFPFVSHPDGLPFSGGPGVGELS